MGVDHCRLHAPVPEQLLNPEKNRLTLLSDPLFSDLLRHPADHREACLRADLRFRTWGFVELLVVRSLEAATQDTEQSEEFGRLALTASSLLDRGFYGTEPIEDLRARAWGHIANARRVRSDLDGEVASYLRQAEHDPSLPFQISEA